jgi:hypothetical protein
LGRGAWNCLSALSLIYSLLIFHIFLLLFLLFSFPSPYPLLFLFTSLSFYFSGNIFFTACHSSSPHTCFLYPFLCFCIFLTLSCLLFPLISFRFWHISFCLCLTLFFLFSFSFFFYYPLSRPNVIQNA